MNPLSAQSPRTSPSFSDTSSLIPEEKLATLLQTYSSVPASGNTIGRIIQNLVKDAPCWHLRNEDMQVLDALPMDIMATLQEVYNAAADKNPQQSSITLIECNHIPSWLSGFSNTTRLTFKEFQWVDSPNGHLDFSLLTQQFHHAPIISETAFHVDIIDETFDVNSPDHWPKIPDDIETEISNLMKENPSAKIPRLLEDARYRDKGYWGDKMSGRYRHFREWETLFSYKDNAPNSTFVCGDIVFDPDHMERSGLESKMDLVITSKYAREQGDQSPMRGVPDFSSIRRELAGSSEQDPRLRTDGKEDDSGAPYKKE